MSKKTTRKYMLALPLTAITLAVSSAYAAPVVGPSDLSFYDATPVAGGNHGDLIAYRSTTVNVGDDTLGTKAWTVKYQSTNSKGTSNVVTGTVIVPTDAWTGAGPRPIMSYAVGTHGLAQPCAPSFQLNKGTDYEAANIRAALKAGYAVLVSDYQGYTNNSVPTYLAGASQGHAVLDIVRAATQLTDAGLTATAKTVIWGYSQGGQSAAWAGQLKSTYTPSMNLVGVAAGGVPADFVTTADVLDGSAGASFLFAGIIGLSQEYPDLIPINSLTNPVGQTTIARGKTECVFEALFDLMNHNLAEYTLNNQSLHQIEINTPSTVTAMKAQDLGGDKVSVPLYQYHGQADEFIPLNQAYLLKRKYCAKFSDVTFDLFPSEHIATQFQGAKYALGWLGDRLAGTATKGSCSSTLPDPVSTANPGGGNFIVSLKSWPLTASVGLKTLAQTVYMPAASSFTADTDITAKTLKGSLFVPDFKQSLKILGIGSQVGMRITPVGDTTGTATLDNNGILKVHGAAYADITITSLSGIPFGDCKTQTPVKFPLDFEGPVSSLGNGGLTFTGSTSFPMIKGCIISGILSAFMSGSGQTYSFTVAPPAPVRY
ncbi:lipase family protein [Aquabacterium sp.]|uniref:lipase family protein n=1 Tax=Aquabacterium sp. TaxID=1872578 RepID=UPI0025BBB33B|nr:lipase family protein [Aquabacterium sp.]